MCRRCNRVVALEADRFHVFEKMHYVCFHYEFEHDPYDVDEECGAGGCPSATINPRPERRPAKLAIGHTGQAARTLDLTATPDDPSGYVKLRAFLASTAKRLELLGRATAEQVNLAARSVDLPSEWLGESAFAIKSTLAIPGLPADLTEDLQSALDAIRTGFRRVGTEPTF